MKHVLSIIIMLASSIMICFLCVGCSGESPVDNGVFQIDLSSIERNNIEKEAARYVKKIKNEDVHTFIITDPFGGECVRYFSGIRGVTEMIIHSSHFRDITVISRFEDLTTLRLPEIDSMQSILNDYYVDTVFPKIETLEVNCIADRGFFSTQTVDFKRLSHIFPNLSALIINSGIPRDGITDVRDAETRSVKDNEAFLEMLGGLSKLSELNLSLSEGVSFDLLRSVIDMPGIKTINNIPTDEWDLSDPDDLDLSIEGWFNYSVNLYSYIIEQELASSIYASTDEIPVINGKILIAEKIGDGPLCLSRDKQYNNNFNCTAWAERQNKDFFIPGDAFASSLSECDTLIILYGEPEFSGLYRTAMQLQGGVEAYDVDYYIHVVDLRNKVSYEPVFLMKSDAPAKLSSGGSGGANGKYYAFADHEYFYSKILDYLQ